MLPAQTEDRQQGRPSILVEANGVRKETIPCSVPSKLGHRNGRLVMRYHDDVITCSYQVLIVED